MVRVRHSNDLSEHTEKFGAMDSYPKSPFPNRVDRANDFWLDLKLPLPTMQKFFFLVEHGLP